ncbi:MAG: PRC-barrel domain-containing protein, partial [Balneolales bacterium]
SQVFRYEDSSGSRDMGALEQQEEGTRQDRRDDESRDERTDNGTSTGQQAGVVQGQGQQSGAKASELMGNDVVNQEDDNLGSLNDLAIDFENSRVVYALVRSGGFLGIGASTRALPPQLLQHSPEEQRLIVNIDEERWNNAPTYDKDELAEMTDETRGQEIYAYFDQPWESEDLGMRQDQAEARQQQFGDDNSDNETGGPSAAADTVEDGGEAESDLADERAQADQLQESRTQDDVDLQGQTSPNRLGFADELTGNSITGPNQEEVGEIEDFLVDLENGRAKFVVFTASDDFLQAGDSEGMDTGYDEGTRNGTDQEREPGETGAGQDVTGRDQPEQAQDAAEQTGDNRYAIIVSAFRISPEDENQLMLEDIDRREFTDAQTLDERWRNMDMEVMADNRVFRFRDNDARADEMGTGQDPENGIFRDRDGD